MDNYSRKLRTSEKMFRRLVCLYPRDFRVQFGREMLQTFRDRCREVMRHGPRLGLTLLWAETLLDLAVTAPVEHLERRNLVKVLSDDFSWDMRHLLKMVLKCIGWVLGGLAAVFLAGWLICTIYAWRKEPAVVQAWEQAVGTSPDMQFQSLLKTHPKAPSNETALELERIVRQFQVVQAAMPVTKTPESGQGQLEPINTVLASRYVDQQIRRAHDYLDPVPEEISNYLGKHAADLNALYHLLNNSARPHWETDYAKRLSAPVPNLQYFRQLQDIIALDAFDKVHRGENSDAQDAIKASWRISRSILDRPELISQVVGLALLKVEAGVLRKTKAVPAEWHNQLNLDLRNSVLNSLKLDAAVVFQAFINHEGESRSGSAGVEWWGHYLGYFGAPLFHLWALQDLQAMVVSLKDLQFADICSFDPDQAHRQYLNSTADIGEGKNYVPNGYRAWKLATLTMAELEITREVLKLKSVMQSKKGEENLRQLTTADSGLCPHIKWQHVLESDGSVTIKGNRLPVWMAVEEKHELPLSYTVSR
jgi:hypothetical protein